MCSGIEAASLAWQPLGLEAAWFAEIEPFPSAVLAHRYPHVPTDAARRRASQQPCERIKLKAIADSKAYFASLRARQAQPIVILAELPPEQAFDLWKQHVLGDKPD